MLLYSAAGIGGTEKEMGNDLYLGSKCVGADKNNVSVHGGNPHLDIHD